MIPALFSGSRLGSLRRPQWSVCVVLLLAFLYGFVRPARADVAIGTSSAGFLNFEIGARSSGMAGTGIGFGSGVTSQFWNPAFLADLNRPEIGGMHASWMGDLNFEWLGYARPVSPNLGVGSISVAYFHMPSINGVDQFDNPTGEFRVYDMALTAGLARPLTRSISAGLNVKMLRQSLAGVSGTGAAVDFGTRARYAGTTFGASVQNLGPSLSLGGSAYPLPRQIRFGMSRGFYGDRVTLAADYNIPRDYYQDIRVGTEVRPYEIVSLRLGYRKELGSSGDPSTGISFGIGLHVKQLSLDYAMTPSSVFDDVQRLSFGYSFGGGGEERPPEPKKPEEKPAPPPPPTGPKVIARATPPKSAPATTQASQSTAQASAAKAAPAPAAPAQAVVATGPVQGPMLPTDAPAPSPAPSKSLQYDVVLGAFQTEDGARSELKALEILGFSVKDARIAALPGGGYRLSVARFGSRKSADDLAATLTKMSFQPRVEVAQK